MLSKKKSKKLPKPPKTPVIKSDMSKKSPKPASLEDEISLDTPVPAAVATVSNPIPVPVPVTVTHPKSVVQQSQMNSTPLTPQNGFITPGTSLIPVSADPSNAEVQYQLTYNWLMPRVTPDELTRWLEIRNTTFETDSTKIDILYCKSLKAPEFSEAFAVMFPQYLADILDFISAHCWSGERAVAQALTGMLKYQKVAIWACERKSEALSWREFVDIYYQHFTASEQYQQRNACLLELQRGPHEKFSNFLVRFLQAATASKLSKDTLIHVLVKNTPYALRASILTVVATNMALNIEGIVAHAQGLSNLVGTVHDEQLPTDNRAVVFNHRRKREHNRGNFPDRPGGPKRFSGKCFNCQKPGHKAETCRVKKESTPVFRNKRKSNYIVSLLSHRKSVQIVSEDSGKSSRPLLPIEVGHIKVWAALDTCADRSLINPKLVDELKLTSAQSEVRVDEGESTKFVDAIGGLILSVTHSIVLTVHYDKILVPHRFFIVDNLIEDMLVGADLYPLLGIQIRGIPSNFPSEFESNLHEQDDSLADRDDPLSKAYPDDVRANILESIKQEVKLNQQLGDGPTCTLEEAVV